MAADQAPRPMGEQRGHYRAGTALGRHQPTAHRNRARRRWRHAQGGRWRSPFAAAEDPRGSQAPHAGEEEPYQGGLALEPANVLGMPVARRNSAITSRPSSWGRTISPRSAGGELFGSGQRLLGPVGSRRTKTDALQSNDALGVRDPQQWNASRRNQVACVIAREVDLETVFVFP